MKPWNARSPEIAALFNPAFCGMVIYSAVDGYLSRKDAGMPYELAFLILPIILHPPTRNSLPKSVATPLQTWINETPTLRIELPERVRTAIPITRESLMFLLGRGVIKINKGALTLGAKKPKLSAARSSQSLDIRGGVQSAASLGRLLANAGRPATIYASLGIAP